MCKGILIGGLLLSGGIFAQSSLEISRHYAMEDGISHLAVTALVQDSRGFLWVGTVEGLNRFDGETFRKYYSKRDDPHGLPLDLITDLIEYQPGHLLIATYNGLAVLNTESGFFENERIHFDPLKAGSAAYIMDLQQDKEGNIYVMSNGELDVFDAALNYCYRLTDQQWASSLKGIGIYLDEWDIDNQGRWWVPAEAGVVVLDLNKHEVLNKFNHPNDNIFSIEGIRTLEFLDDTTLIVSSSTQGTLQYHLYTHTLTPVPGIAGHTVDELVKLENGNLLMTIDESCYELNPVTGNQVKVTRVVDLTDRKDPPFYAMRILQAGSGDVWVGTWDGLFRLRKTIGAEVISGLPRIRESSIKFTRSSVYVLDTSGLLRINRTSKDFDRMNVPGKTERGINFNTTMEEDLLGRIWIGTEEGIRLYLPDSNKLVLIPYLPAELRSARIRKLYEDSEQQMWVTTEDPIHVIRVDIRDESTVSFSDSLFTPFILPDGRGHVNVMKEDDQKRLWMTNKDKESGLLSYDLRGGNWHYYEDGVSGALIPDRMGAIWINQYHSSGIIRYDYQEDCMESFTREDGLLSNAIWSMFLDKHDYLWLTSDFGIVRFNTRTLVVEGYYNFSQDISYPVHIDPFTDQFVLSGTGKIIFIEPSALIDTSVSPVAVLDEFLVDNQPQQLRVPAHYQLQTRQKHISIGFTAINQSSSQKLQFRYILKGRREQWEATTTSRSADFTFLPSGHYSFSVSVMNGTGFWGESRELVSFSILPPLWLRFEFLIPLLFILVVAAIGLFYRRLRAIRHESELKQKIAETEMMALRAQMNPHFIFNCINNIDALVQNDDKVQATRFLNKFARLIRSILDSSRHNVVPLSRDVETLRLYIEMEQFRQGNRFEVVVQTDDALMHGDYKVPPMVMQPFVENAILHGLYHRTAPGGKLSLKLLRTNDHIRYVVEDNGIGREASRAFSHEGQESYGIQMSLDRIRLFNEEDMASVEIIDLISEGKPVGTRVEALLKVK